MGLPGRSKGPAGGWKWSLERWGCRYGILEGCGGAGAKAAALERTPFWDVGSFLAGVRGGFVEVTNAVKGLQHSADGAGMVV